MNIAMSYDEKYDILYARYPNCGHSYGEEDDENGVVIYHSIETDAVTGMAVFSIRKKLKLGEIDLSKLPIPLELGDHKINMLLAE